MSNVNRAALAKKMRKAARDMPGLTVGYVLESMAYVVENASEENIRNMWQELAGVAPIRVQRVCDDLELVYDDLARMKPRDGVTKKDLRMARAAVDVMQTCVLRIYGMRTAEDVYESIWRWCVSACCWRPD